MVPPTVGTAAIGKHDAVTPPEGNPALDRNAVTGTLAPQTPLMARHGTESLAAPLSPAAYPAMLEPTPPPVAFPTPVSPIPIPAVHAAGAPPFAAITLPTGKRPSPVLRKSAMVAMVASIAVSAFLASVAIVVVARHQTELKREPVEPVASAATLAPTPAVAAGQAQLQASGTTEPQGLLAGTDAGL